MKLRLFTVPNIITLCNLMCGAAAAAAALVENNLRASFWLIVAAAVFDFFDGFAARLLKQHSPVGKELDSLADVISFGFAPSAILFVMFRYAGGGYLWAFGAFLLAAFSALRLAKFNLDERQSDEFIGLPTPAAALFTAGAGYVFMAGGIDPSPFTIMATAVVLSALLVSEIRMFSLKFHNFGFAANKLRYIFMAATLLSVVIFGVPAVPLAIAAYIAISVARHFMSSKKPGRA